MLLSHKSVIELDDMESNIIGHMCYSAYKLWNACNYERHNYKTLSLPVDYPDWYYQKKAHKDDLWYKNLPSQTAQEICKLLDKAWKSFYALKKTGGIANPKPPKYKQDSIPITYTQNGIVHNEGSSVVRLSIPKQLKEYMYTAYGISAYYLYLQNVIFEDTDTIKQIVLYPPKNNKCEAVVVYEVSDNEMLPDNGRYLSIDLGLHNLMTCYNSASGETFITGRKYLSICQRYDKEIGRVQSQWYKQQNDKVVKYPKTSKHITSLYKKKKDTIHDYIHKVTRNIVTYCKANNINTVVIGNITGIRKDNDKGGKLNQKLHSLPYKKLYDMLCYKLSLEGIRFVKQKEAYTSQTSPLADKVSKTNATKSKRIKRGLYKDGIYEWNADCVGAFNILRLYLKKIKSNITLDPMTIKVPYVLKVAV